MDKKTKNLKGSPSRDNFKWWHKKLSRTWYAIDIDLVPFDFTQGILGFIDYKLPKDHITVTEIAVYDELTEHGFEVVIAEGAMPEPNDNMSSSEAFKDVAVYKYTDFERHKNGVPYIKWEATRRKKEKE